MFKFLLKRKWRLRFWNMIVLYAVFFLTVNSYMLKKENVRIENENIEKTNKLVATQDVLTNLDEYYPGLGSGAEEIIKAALGEDYDNKKIIKPLIDNAIKINVELHGLNKYTVRFDELIYPVKDIEFAYISSEFGIREVNYSLWKKKHYTFLKEYSEDDKKIMYVDENYEFKGEWVTNNKRYEIHYGIDICNSYEGGIIASGDGIVDKVGWNDSAGNYIMIKHFIEGKVKFTYYGHLSKIKVNKGQIVAQGQDIGNMGQTGFEQTGKHVHFAIFEYNLKTNKTIYDNAVINTTYYGKKIMDSSI